MARLQGNIGQLIANIKKQADGCWLLPFKPDWNGYFRVRLKGKRILAHRAFYEYYKGLIPEGLVIDHLCRNRACVNPEHLEAVTYSVNNKRGAKYFGTVYIDNKY